MLKYDNKIFCVTMLPIKLYKIFNLGDFMSIRKITFPYYQLKQGENLKSVAQKFDVEPTKILLDNNMSPKQIKEGVFILIKK